MSMLNFEEIAVFEKDFAPYGNFKVKMPTAAQQIRIMADVKSYVGDASDDEISQGFSEALVTLGEVVIEKPEDFPSFEDCYDTELILDIWNWYLECQNSFYEAVKKKKESLNKK